jgi:hypothetical protein
LLSCSITLFKKQTSSEEGLYRFEVNDIPSQADFDKYTFLTASKKLQMEKILRV